LRGLEAGAPSCLIAYQAVVSSQPDIDEAGGEAKVVIATMDLEPSGQGRRNRPFLRNRRIDAYGDLLKRWRDSLSGIRGKWE